jgi:dephospho-CoA kinase
MEEIQAVTTSTPPPPPITPRSPYCLALTGGIACGKSTVGAILEQLGLARVDTDLVARQVVLPGSPGLAAVVERFGPQILTPEETMDRREVGRIVFSDAQARRDLEAIIHPLVWQVLAHEMHEADRQHRETVFEIPLLFEKGHQGRFSTVWVVSAQREQSLRRLMTRDGLSREQAEARYDSQLSVAEKARQASFVIHNEGEPEDLERQVQRGLLQWRATRVHS